MPIQRWQFFHSFLCRSEAANPCFCVFLSDRLSGISRILPAIRRRKSKFSLMSYSVLSVFSSNNAVRTTTMQLQRSNTAIQ